MKAPLEQQVTWVYTHNLNSTAKFYSDALGLEQVLDQGLCRIYRTSLTSFLGVCQVREGRYVEPKGVVITLVTPAVDSWYQILTAQNVETLGPPELNSSFNIYAFFAKDPEGYLIEFQQFLSPDWPKP
mmetsp:Transcript_340/g.723  ORF Transcript_340/g.723 Transcript_340/m.723 type:complete len:128 (-) Transcript_340:711-1094(-)